MNLVWDNYSCIFTIHKLLIMFCLTNLQVSYPKWPPQAQLWLVHANSIGHKCQTMVKFVTLYPMIIKQLMGNTIQTLILLNFSHECFVSERKSHPNIMLMNYSLAWKKQKRRKVCTMPSPSGSTTSWLSLPNWSIVLKSLRNTLFHQSPWNSHKYYHYFKNIVELEMK